MTKFFPLLFLGILSSPAHALILGPLDSSSIKVEVPYTMGTHELSASELGGSVNFNPVVGEISSGNLTLPVTALKNDNAELVCHMRESLTLDYEKSDFPGSHVCEDDKLPTEGKNAPVHHDIVAEIQSPVKLGASEVPVIWTIHGVKKTISVPVTSSWDATSSKLTLEGKLTFKRSDFDIEVKKFLFIGVDNKIPVKFRIELGERK